MLIKVQCIVYVPVEVSLSESVLLLSSPLCVWESTVLTPALSLVDVESVLESSVVSVVSLFGEGLTGVGAPSLSLCLCGCGWATIGFVLLASSVVKTVILRWFFL